MDTLNVQDVESINKSSVVKLLIRFGKYVHNILFQTTRATLAFCYFQCENRRERTPLKGKHLWFKVFSLIAIICSTLKTLQKQVSLLKPGSMCIEIFRVWFTFSRHCLQFLLSLQINEIPCVSDWLPAQRSLFFCYPSLVTCDMCFNSKMRNPCSILSAVFAVL